MEHTRLHASCVAIGGKAVLLIGPSGSGKSDLALRLIERGGVLVGDDQVIIKKQGSALFASPAQRLEGLLEARGVGILTLPYAENIAVLLVVNFIPGSRMERLPEKQFFDCLNVRISLLSLDPFEQSTPAKIMFYLADKLSS